MLCSDVSALSVSSSLEVLAGEQNGVHQHMWSWWWVVVDSETSVSYRYHKLI